MNLEKTKVMIFHTSEAIKREMTITLVGGQVEVVGAYVYLGITFTGSSGRFYMGQAVRDRVT